jgi:hypothetical protein
MRVAERWGCRGPMRAVARVNVAKTERTWCTHILNPEEPLHNLVIRPAHVEEREVNLSRNFQQYWQLAEHGMRGQFGAQAHESIGRQRGPEDEERQPPASWIAMGSRRSRPDVRVLFAQCLCSCSDRQRFASEVCPGWC